MQHYYLLCFLLLFFGITFILRSYVTWKNTRVNPFAFERTDDAHGFNGRLFVFIIVLEFLVIIIHTFFENLHAYLLPIWYLESSNLQMLGWALLHLSLIWVSIAQHQMSDSWRIGIDDKNKTTLVTKGLFAYSRNPIFLGIMITNLGLLFVLPNAMVLLILVLSYTVIQTQVRLEEDFLSNTFGNTYQQYKSQVRRWL